ncbi:hypothetical protein XELAEV_18007425mg [Xenopus laevis]|uniref:Uncharacterized protein n=1 Tax=Xenopus laevis TaxID=8355 RepID=A0A974E1Q8_XENLA|nr:hypothetical protein XELAEV_18007425mg [Xenopus laevis]
MLSAEWALLRTEVYTTLSLCNLWHINLTKHVKRRDFHVQPIRAIDISRQMTIHVLWLQYKESRQGSMYYQSSMCKNIHDSHILYDPEPFVYKITGEHTILYIG